jgi:uncharacterized membrane protein
MLSRVPATPIVVGGAVRWTGHAGTASGTVSVRRGTPLTGMNADELHEALRDAYEVSLPAFEPPGRFERRDGYDLLCAPSVPVAELNGVWPNDEAATLAAIDEVRRELVDAGSPFALQLRAGSTDAFRDELERRGLRETHRNDGMLVRRRELVEPRRTDAEVEVEVVTDDATLEIFVRTAAAGFGSSLEHNAAQFTPRLRRLPGESVILVRAAGEPVSTAACLVRGDAVGIFGVATTPQGRGRGYGSLATWRACAIGFEAGARFAYLRSSALGNPVYRGLGFRTVETYSWWELPEPRS